VDFPFHRLDEIWKYGNFPFNSLSPKSLAKSLKAVALHLDPETDLLARVDGFYLVAPGWKRCRECGHLDHELKLADILPTVGIGERIQFSESGNGLTYLAAGWSNPQAWGTWSNGLVAEVVLPMSGAGISGI